VIRWTRRAGVGMLAVVATVFFVSQAVARPAERAAVAATTVNVTAGKPQEFRFRLSKATVARGIVTFKVKNTGQLPHNFKIAGKKTRVLNPGQSATLKVNLRTAKRYPYLCTVSGHAAAGMKGTLRVR
jgi:uncharacterized cupredoxin-like copper-binding protein